MTAAVAVCTNPDCGRAIVHVTSDEPDPEGRCFNCAHGIPPEPKKERSGRPAERGQENKGVKTCRG